MRIIDKFEAKDDNGKIYLVTVYKGKDIPGGLPIEGLRTYRLDDGRTAKPKVKGNDSELIINGTDTIIRKVNLI